MPQPNDRDEPDRSPADSRWRGWLHPSILAVAALSVASGYASFAVVAALGDVALAFGEPGPEETIAATAGLAATTVGIGLAVVRLAALGSLVLAGLADRLGRRRIILLSVIAGLGLTLAAAGAPGFWWVVAVLALARPALSATNAIAAVIAAEETGSAERAKALGLIAGSYALGAGLTSLVRLAIPAQLGFRGLFLTALVPLALVWLLARVISEPDRYRVLAQPKQHPRIGAIKSHLRARLAVLCVVTFAFGFVTGPINTNLFFYGENILGVSSTFMFLLVAVGGVVGLAGLFAGRWVADSVGRRLGAGVMLVLLSAASMLTYSGEVSALAAGYWLSLFAGGAFTPPAGSLDAELFPTSQRATAAGWITASNVLGAVAGLVLFGVLVDAFEEFTLAAVLIGIPVILAAGLYSRVPETRGREPEDVAPEDPGDSG